MGQSRNKNKKTDRRHGIVVLGIMLSVCIAVAFIAYDRCYRAEVVNPAALRVDPEMLLMKEQRKKFEAYALFHTFQEHEITKLVMQQNFIQHELSELSNTSKSPDIDAQIASKKMMLNSLVQQEMQLFNKRELESQRIEKERKRLDSLEKEYQQRKNITPDEYAAGYEIDEQELKICGALEKKAGQSNYDIAELSMLLVKGLPGTDKLNEPKLLKTLDAYANRVKAETERHMYRYKEDSKEYANSEAYFRVLMMTTVLQQDFNVRYNLDPEKRASPQNLSDRDMSFFNDTSDIFLYGLLNESPQGTCASLPVLYVAVGRRLGYPLKLVSAKEHWFARWEDTSQRFNIECTSDKGVNCYPDAEYRKWPYSISDAEMAAGMYLKSLTPKRELAALLNLRAICLAQSGKRNCSLTCKLYADELMLKEGVDLKVVNMGLAKQAKAQMGMAVDQNRYGNRRQEITPVVAIEWLDAHPSNVSFNSSLTSGGGAE